MQARSLRKSSQASSPARAWPHRSAQHVADRQCCHWQRVIISACRRVRSPAPTRHGCARSAASPPTRNAWQRGATSGTHSPTTWARRESGGPGRCRQEVASARLPGPPAHSGHHPANGPMALQTMWQHLERLPAPAKTRLPAVRRLRVHTAPIGPSASGPGTTTTAWRWGRQRSGPRGGTCAVRCGARGPP